MTSLRLLKVHSNVNLDQDFYVDGKKGCSWFYKIEGIHLNRNSDTLRLHKVHSDHDSEEDIMACKDYHDYEVERVYDSVMKIASKMQLGLDFEIPSYELRYLCWDGYPLDSLPSNFDGENLVELHLKCSNIKQLWQENKVLLSFHNDFFFFILILKLLIVISFIETIFFRCSILKV